MQNKDFIKSIYIDDKCTLTITYLILGEEKERKR